jgi:hypothetical protein
MYSMRNRFQRYQRCAEPLAVGPLPGDARHRRAHLGRRLADVHVRPQPAEDTEIRIGPVQPCVVKRNYDIDRK